VEEASGRREHGPTVLGWSAQGEAGQPPPEPSGAPLCSGAFWCLPEFDDVCFIADKFCSFYAIQSSFFSFLE
jgi:hypothetical protein